MLPKLAGDVALAPRERAALDFAQRLATDHTSIDDTFMIEMHKHFTDPELVELGLTSGAFIIMGRLHYAFGVPPGGAKYFWVSVLEQADP